MKTAFRIAAVFAALIVGQSAIAQQMSIPLKVNVSLKVELEMAVAYVNTDFYPDPPHY